MTRSMTTVRSRRLKRPARPIQVKPSAEVVWHQLENLVYHTVRAFQRRYGGDFEDLFGEAQLAFMKAYTSFDPNPQHGNGNYHIGGWVKFVIWNRLKDALAIKIRHDDRLKRVGLPNQGAEEFFNEANFGSLEDTPGFSLDKLLGEVSAEAADVIRYALSAPQPSQPYQKQLALVRLLQELGWAGQQILKSFQEIREALS
jgi:hypothetical protein